MPGFVTVRLFHRLREVVGEKRVRISPVPGGVIDLIHRFLELYPQAKEEMLDEVGELSHTYVVVVNEKILKRTDWDGAAIHDGDEVAFLTMISGG